MKYLAMLLVPVVLILGCATTAPRDATGTDLVGIWQSFEKGGTEADLSPFVAATLTYGNDGSFLAQLEQDDGYVEDVYGTYEVDSAVVTYLLNSGDTPEFTATMTGRELLLKDRDSDMWMRFLPKEEAK